MPLAGEFYAPEPGPLRIDDARRRRLEQEHETKPLPTPTDPEKMADALAAMRGTIEPGVRGMVGATDYGTRKAVADRAAREAGEKKTAELLRDASRQAILDFFESVDATDEEMVTVGASVKRAGLSESPLGLTMARAGIAALRG